jgi:hypothetical protein
MRRSARSLLVVLSVVAVDWPGAAWAYPWMVRHGYSGCGVCHVDPSGAGLLTEYGRAQSELLLATQFGSDEQEEATSLSQFAFGVFKLPDWLLLGFSYRGAELLTRATTNDAAGNQVATATDRRYVQMVADLRMALRFSHFRASGTLGWAPQQASPISITSKDKNNIVSREYWVGWELGEESGLVRLGRLDLPFGLRNVEHTAWVRASTRTDINYDQQHGVALFLGGDALRGEIMAIAGNFQLKPDDYRERGFSGYIEAMAGPSLAVGLSSLVTRAERGLSTGVPTLRQAYGAHLRWGIFPELGLLAEGDVFLENRLGSGVIQTNSATWTQLDWEPVQGLHVMPALETLQQYGDVGGVSFGEWLTVDWFIQSHVELRIDFTLRQQPQSSGSSSSVAGLFQIHVLL